MDKAEERSVHMESDQSYTEDCAVDLELSLALSAGSID